jgi:hypothetical protein
MKSPSSFPFLAAALGSAVLAVFCGCSRSADSSSTTVVVTDASANDAGPDVWERIKDFTFDRRADFSAGIDRMSKDMDDKTAVFRAKVAAVPDAASRDRDSAMKGYDDARADLKEKRTSLDKATADTWSDAKAKTAKAWTNTKAAYDKVTKANGGS